MKFNSKTWSVSALAMLMSTSALYAGSIPAVPADTQTRSLNASTSTALSADTGFLTGAQVQVDGTGQGSVVLSRDEANISAISGATAGIGPDGVPTSGSSMVTTFEFDREVNTAGAMVGIGSLVAEGESIGGTGILGTSNGSATFTGTRDVGAGQAGNAASTTTAQGSLVGSFNTRNTIQMLGRESLFAGAQSLDLGERNVGVSAGITGDISADAASIDLDTIAATTGTPGSVSVSGAGSIFSGQSTLEQDVIDVNVANAGGGSILVTGSTGGFFGTGTVAAASGSTEFADVGDTGGFFTNP